MRIYFIVFLALIVVKKSEAIGNVFNVVNNVGIRAGFDSKLKNFLEGFKETMKHGNESLGIPRLDPFQSDSFSLNINTEDLVGKFFTSSITIQSLSDFVVSKATLKIFSLKTLNMTLDIALEWPKIEGEIFNYTLSDGRLMNFVNVFGHGSAILLIENIKFSIELPVIADNVTQFLSIAEVKASISIGDNKETGNTELYTEGLYDDVELSQLFSGVLSELAPAAFDTYYVQMISTLNKFITDAGNKFLDGKTWKDLLHLIT